MSKTSYTLATPSLTAEELDRVLANEIAAVQNDSSRVKQATAIASLADTRIKLAALRIQVEVMKQRPQNIRLLEKPLGQVE